VHVITVQSLPLKVSFSTTFDLLDLSVDPNPSRSYLLCACTDRLIRLLDVSPKQHQAAGGTACHVLYAFNLSTLGKTVHVRWCLGDPEQFVACSDDKCVRVWSLRECIKNGG
jgi:WD40 repeat protein